jgi:hypothetical protein
LRISLAAHQCTGLMRFTIRGEQLQDLFRPARPLHRARATEQLMERSRKSSHSMASSFDPSGRASRNAMYFHGWVSKLIHIWSAMRKY